MLLREFNKKLIHSWHPHILSWSHFYALKINVINVILLSQVYWVWWPTWCSPQPSSWLSAWAQRTGNPKHGTTAGPTCEFTDSCSTCVQVYLVYPDTRCLHWTLSPLCLSGYIRSMAHMYIWVEQADKQRDCVRKALIKVTTKAQVTTLKE